MKVSVSGIDDIEALAEIWQKLESEADVSYFQSWGWISVWLKMLPSTVVPRLFVFDEAGTTLGLAIFVDQKIRRHHIFVSNALFLNEAGMRQYDFIIEHNGLVIKKGYEESVSQAFINLMTTEHAKWDEIYLSGIRAQSLSYIEAVAKKLDVNVIALRDSSSKYVDLKLLRDTNQDYLATLSSNTRYQIRRSIRKYEESGAIEIHIATTLADAHEFFDGLKILHQDYWMAKSKPGSFSNPSWEEFHRALIDHRFSLGEIQLLRISAGQKIIGYLYNFVKYGCVYVLQSGFAYESSNALHPGYVSHYFAVEYNLAQGQDRYDFLAGENRYKDSLSDGNTQLVWVVLQRKRLRFLVEEQLKTLYRASHQLISAGARLRRRIQSRGIQP